jgi:hypothetical protein
MLSAKAVNARLSAALLSRVIHVLKALLRSLDDLSLGLKILSATWRIVSVYFI